LNGFLPNDALGEFEQKIGSHVSQWLLRYVRAIPEWFQLKPCLRKVNTVSLGTSST